MIEKLISGGQTGADRSGLEAAKALGIPTGGTAPKGWRIENPDGSQGSDPSLPAFGLVEHESPEYPPRTKQNAVDSDGTVWFGYVDSNGAKLTLITAQKNGKPTIVNLSPSELRRWIRQFRIKVLNVAGNRLSHHNPEIAKTTYATLIEALSVEDDQP